MSEELKQNESEALNKGVMVDELMAQGYKFVTVEELFALRGVEPQDGKEYRKLHPQG